MSKVSTMQTHKMMAWLLLKKDLARIKQHRRSLLSTTAAACKQHAYCGILFGVNDSINFFFDYIFKIYPWVGFQNIGRLQDLDLFKKLESFVDNHLIQKHSTIYIPIRIKKFLLFGPPSLVSLGGLKLLISLWSGLIF